MSLAIARSLVFLMGAYALVGLLVAPWLIFSASGRFDPAVARSTRGFRVLVLPGAMLLWPLLLVRWLGGAAALPIERNAHRDAAGDSEAHS